MKRSMILGLLVAPALVVSAMSAELVITQKDKQFSQEAVTMKAGDKMRMVNDDSVTHNVVVKDASGASRPGITQKPGEQSEIGFDNAGDYEVRCLIHPKMKLSVKVE
jgi:plastocyanin